MSVRVPDGDALLPLLGKPLDDPSVLACLAQVARGIHPELDPDDEDIVADWVTLNEIGLEFGFEDTAFLFALDEDLRRQNGVTLSQLYFYGDTPQMQPFPSRLPFGLDFSDNRAAARAKLAAYEPTRRSYIRDAWRLPGFDVTVAYDDRDLLESVFCHVPHSPWPPLAPPPPLTPDEFSALFGLRWSNTGLRKALARYGYDQVLGEVRDEHVADFRRLCGLEVEFAAGADLRAADPRYPKALAVGAIVYYAERETDARGWTGPLPFGLSFDDVQDDLIRKVGRPPDDQEDDVLSGSCTWHFDDTSLRVIYSNLENRPLRITFAAAGYLA